MTFQIRVGEEATEAGATPGATTAQLERPTETTPVTDVTAPVIVMIPGPVTIWLPAPIAGATVRTAGRRTGGVMPAALCSSAGGRTALLGEIRKGAITDRRIMIAAIAAIGD